MPQNDVLPTIQASGSPVRRRCTSESSNSRSSPAHASNSEASSRAATNPALESSAASESRSSGIDTLVIGPCALGEQVGDEPGGGAGDNEGDHADAEVPEG